MMETFVIASGAAPSHSPGPTVVGNKAANLAGLGRVGLPVPPAIVLATSVWRDYIGRGRLPDDVRTQIAGDIHRLEALTGLVFGGRDPLLVSVRSSPGVSMPGMLETVVDVGLNPDLVRGLIRRTGNPWLAWDAYRRFVRSFAEVVMHLAPSDFDRLDERAIARAGVRGLDELDAITMRAVAMEAVALADGHGRALPADPMDQLLASIAAVFDSWNAPRAVAYRRSTGIAEDVGTGAIVQAMVFGNAGPRSGSGVGFTRNPSTGEDEIFIDFAFNAQGDDVVAGRHGVQSAERLRAFLPDAYRDLVAARRLLERGFRDMQDFEFTIEEGRLYFLQTRDGKRTPWAALQIAVDLVSDGILTGQEALARLAGCDLDAIIRTRVRATGATELAHGIAAVPGAVSGPVRLSNAADDIDAWHRAIMVRRELATEDFPALLRASGLLTALGGRTSHAAVVARQLNRPCVVGCAELEIDLPRRTCVIGGTRLCEGDVITIDGATGTVYAGEMPVVTERPDALLATVAKWRAEQHGRRSSVMSVANP